MAEKRGVYGDLVGKPKRNRLFGRSRRRLEDNIKMYIQKVGFVGMDWIDLAQVKDSWRALANAVMNFRVP